MRAIQGYSTEITSVLLDESRKKVNARCEDETQKRIPVYYLGPDADEAEGMNSAERYAAAKIEIGMPGGLPNNFPDVIDHDTESIYRESIIEYGLKPGGSVAK